MIVSRIIFGISIALLCITMACSADEPDNMITFESSQLVLSASQQQVTVTLHLDRPADTNTPVTLNMQTTDLTYKNQFTIDPEAVVANQTIFLAFAEGESETSFSVVRLGNPDLNGDEEIQFDIATLQSPLVQGDRASVEVLYQ